MAVVMLLGVLTQPTFKAVRRGNPADAHVPCRGGLALLGGDTNSLDDAFRWLLDRAPGGDVLVLSLGPDFYTEYLSRLAPMNSVETVFLKDREATRDPGVLDRVSHAEVIFLAGTEQNRFLKLWEDTPLCDALNQAARHGVAMGGTGASLAVLGEFCFTGEKGPLTSAEALAEPWGDKVIVERTGLELPLLHGVIADPHFSERSRLGRLGVCLARRATDKLRGLGIDEATGLLVEPDGSSRRVGAGSAWFVTLKSTDIRWDQPGGSIVVDTVRLSQPEQRFNLQEWKGDGQSSTHVLKP